MNHDIQLNQAWRHYQNSQYPAAIDLLKSLLSQNPENADAHAVLGACLLEQGRLRAAEHEFNVALSLEHGQVLALVLLGRLALLQNRQEAALEYSDRALEQRPDDIDALLLKQQVYLLRDDRQSAFQCLQQALELAPESLTVKVELGEYYLSTGDREQAASWAAEALSADPQSPAAHVLMGQVCLAMGNVEDAREHACYAVSQNPESREALSLLGNIKLRRNPVIGLWWRVNAWLATLSHEKTVVVLIGAYLLFGLCAQILSDTGYETSATLFSYAWLLIVAYSWLGLPLYYRALRAELKKVTLAPDF